METPQNGRIASHLTLFGQRYDTKVAAKVWPSCHIGHNQRRVTTTSGTVASGVDAAQLYERYGNQIYRYCLGRLRDREEAADAAQNTFLRVHVALEKGVVPQYEASWLYKIAHNVCLSWIESSGRRALVETPRDLDSLSESALAAPANEHEAGEELAEALAALPQKLRKAFLLREWQGLSYAEIAEAMNTTVPAVETLLVRARRQMKATLEQSGTRLRRAAAAVLDVAGLRGLLSGGLGKVAAGAALVAVGGSGIGATVVLAGRTSSPPERRATSIERPAIAALPTRTEATTPARRARTRTATVSRTTRHTPVPAPTQAVVASPAPVAPAAPTTAAQSPPAPAQKPVRTTATETVIVTTTPAPTPQLAVPSLPPAPTVSTPTVPLLLAVPTTPAIVTTTTAPQLPVTPPAVTVPTVGIP